MKIIRVPAGIYGANCYIIYSNSTMDGIIVDPGGDGELILEKVNKEGIDVKYIILTHGHGDHIGGVKEIKDKLNIPVMIHEEDVELILDSGKNLSNIMPSGPVELQADKLLKDGDKIEFGDLIAEIIHTPGHTKGGITIKIGDNLITGDTLFQGSIGRTDLLGGDYETIIQSIKERLLVLPDEIKVYPGHGLSSTIGRERISNPFLK